MNEHVLPSAIVLGLLCLSGCSGSSDDYVRSGIENEKAHNYEAALSDFNHAIQIDPNNAEAFLGRGRVACQTGFTKPVSDDLTRYIELTSRDMGVAYIGRGLTKLLAQEYHAALEDLDRAIVVDPSNIQGFEFKELALTQSGDTVHLRDFLAGLDPQVLSKMKHPIPTPYKLE